MIYSIKQSITINIYCNLCNANLWKVPVTGTWYNTLGLVRHTGFMFCFTHLLAEWPRASYTILLNLSSPMGKGETAIPTSEGCTNNIMDVEKLRAKIGITLVFLLVLSFFFCLFFSNRLLKSTLIFSSLVIKRQANSRLTKSEKYIILHKTCSSFPRFVTHHEKRYCPPTLYPFLQSKAFYVWRKKICWNQDIKTNLLLIKITWRTPFMVYVSIQISRKINK